MSRSEELFQIAKGIIPGGVSSPVRSCRHVGTTPLFFESGAGAEIVDVDGKRYVDFCLSFGPHILGHSHPRVVKAVQEQAGRAMSYGACHAGEAKLVQAILKGYPFLDQVRLVNSGTEAVMTAVRLARGYTKRNKIVVLDGCYHGHSDGLLAKAGSGVAELSEASSKGVPPSVVADTLIARLDDIGTVERLFSESGSEIAAILLEPIPANNGLFNTPRKTLLALAELAKKHEALLIFDEVISGFRVAPSGASGYFDMKPDLVTLGKVIGGGLPLAALAGRREIMETLAPLGEVYQAGTLSGNPLATAAGAVVLEELIENPPYATFEFSCTAFTEGLKEILGEGVQIPHVGSIFWIHFGDQPTQFPPIISAESRQRYSEFFKQALAAGVYFAPSPYEVSFLSTAHTPELLSATLEKLKACRP